MRIIGSIDHPVMKITIFQSGNRLSVKFENGLYEQTYKFREGENVANVNDIQALVDPEFLQSVERELQNMHQIRLKALARFSDDSPEDEFAEII